MMLTSKYFFPLQYYRSYIWCNSFVTRFIQMPTVVYRYFMSYFGRASTLILIKSCSGSPSFGDEYAGYERQTTTLVLIKISLLRQLYWDTIPPTCLLRLNGQEWILSFFTEVFSNRLLLSEACFCPGLKSKLVSIIVISCDSKIISTTALGYHTLLKGLHIFEIKIHSFLISNPSQ